MIRAVLGGWLVLLAVAAIGVPGARADLVYTLTLDGCTGGCGSGAGPYDFGAITLSQTAADTVHVTQTLNQTAFVGTGSGYSLGWNIGGGLSSVEIANLTSGFVALNPNGHVNTTGTVSSGAFKYSTFGKFGYTVTCSVKKGGSGCGPGGSNMNLGPLSFDITAPGLTPELFVGNSGGFYFASDIYSFGTGKTGNVAANTYASTTTTTTTTTTSQQDVPEPLSAGMLTAGLAGLALVRRRGAARRR